MIQDSERDHVVRVTAGTWGRFEGDESKTYRVGDTVKCTAEELESHRFQVELVSGPKAKVAEPETKDETPDADEETEPEIGLKSQLEDAGVPDIGSLHHQTAVKALGEADPAHLELLRASEESREGGPRPVVLDALDDLESGE